MQMHVKHLKPRMAILYDGDGDPAGSLTFNRRRTRATIHTAGGVCHVRREGLVHPSVRGIGPTGQPVSLAGDRALLPDGSEAAWRLSRNGHAHEAAVTRPGAAITIGLPPTGGQECRVDASGEWEQAELIVLLAYFAACVVRRGLRTLSAAA